MALTKAIKQVLFLIAKREATNLLSNDKKYIFNSRCVFHKTLDRNLSTIDSWSVDQSGDFHIHRIKYNPTELKNLISNIIIWPKFDTKQGLQYKDGGEIVTIPIENIEILDLDLNQAYKELETLKKAYNDMKIDYRSKIILLDAEIAMNRIMVGITILAIIISFIIYFCK